MNAFDMVTNIQYHNWANEQLIATAEKIPLDKLMGGDKLSQGSAFETLRHMLDVDWSWRLTCLEQPAKTVLWELVPLEDLPALKAYWQTEAQTLLDYVQNAPEAEFEKVVTPEWNPNVSYTVKHLLMHIVDHGANHRSELGWYFSKQGHSPGDIGFLDYISQRSG